MAEGDSQNQEPAASGSPVQGGEAQQHYGSTEKALRESGAVVLPTSAAQGIDPVAHMDGGQGGSTQQQSGASGQSNGPVAQTGDASQPSSSSE